MRVEPLPVIVDVNRVSIPGNYPLRPGTYLGIAGHLRCICVVSCVWSRMPEIRKLGACVFLIRENV